MLHQEVAKMLLANQVSLKYTHCNSRYRMILTIKLSPVFTNKCFNIFSNNKRCPLFLQTNVLTFLQTNVSIFLQTNNSTYLTQMIQCFYKTKLTTRLPTTNVFTVSTNKRFNVSPDYKQTFLLFLQQQTFQYYYKQTFQHVFQQQTFSMVLQTNVFNASTNKRFNISPDYKQTFLHFIYKHQWW